MSTKPAITVCLPIFEAGKLHNIAQELKKQSFQDFEVLICVPKAADPITFVGQLNFVQRGVSIVECQPGNGLFVRWDRCLQMAKGRYIKFLTEECLLNADLFKGMFEIFNKNASASVVIAIPETKMYEAGLPQEDAVKSMLLMGADWITESSCIMTRAVDGENKINTNLSIFADIDYVLRLLLHGNLQFYVEHGQCSNFLSKHLIHTPPSVLSLVRSYFELCYAHRNKLIGISSEEIDTGIENQISKMLGSSAAWLICSPLNNNMIESTLSLFNSAGTDKLRSSYNELQIHHAELVRHFAYLEEERDLYKARWNKLLAISPLRHLLSIRRHITRLSGVNG